MTGWPRPLLLAFLAGVALVGVAVVGWLSSGGGW
jgi:hypothetical protein